MARQLNRIESKHGLTPVQRVLAGRSETCHDPDSHCSVHELEARCQAAQGIPLPARGATGPQYEGGLRTHDVNTRLQRTPYSLYGWSRPSLPPRDASAALMAWRTRLVLFDIINVRGAIVIAEAIVKDAEGRELSRHTIV